MDDFKSCLPVAHSIWVIFTVVFIYSCVHVPMCYDECFIFFLLLKNAFQVKSTGWVSLFAFSGFKSGETLSGGKILDRNGKNENI